MVAGSGIPAHSRTSSPSNGEVRARHDLQVNLLTEQKVTKLIHLLEELRRDLPIVRDRHDPQATAMQEGADTDEVVSALREVGLTSDAERSRK